VNRDDLDPLLDDALQTAQQLLQENGEFFPFGVALGADGTRRHVGGWSGTESPNSETLAELLLAGFRRGADAGEYRATGLVQDVRVRDGNSDSVSDAICVTLEHRDGTCINCYLPYARAVSGTFTYGEVFADLAEGTVFAQEDA
jgi:hypothetical protein